MVVETAPEHDRMGEAELEVRQRLEAENLPNQPGMGEVAIGIELAEKPLEAELPQVAEDSRQQAGMDLLNPQRRKRGRVVALGERGEMAGAPPHFFLAEGQRPVSQTQHRLAVNQAKPLAIGKRM